MSKNGKVVLTSEQRVLLREMAAKAVEMREQDRAREKVVRRAELVRIVRFWWESRNLPKGAKVGPDNLSQGQDYGEAPRAATWEFGRVQAALGSFGRGIYSPVVLADLLDHVHGRQEPVESFLLHEPGRGLAKEMLGLGFRTHDLLLLAMERFFEALAKAVEEEPKPE